MKYKFLIKLFSIMIFSFGCSHLVFAQSAFDKEAHRGGRGLMPENTIPAMLHAIDLGVTTLEMDMQVSKDDKIIVSHDPYFNPAFTTTPQGDTLLKEAAKIILHNLDYDSIAKYDVGIKNYPEFPRQKKIHVHKPLLSDLLDATEAYAKKKGRKIYYNIEVKSNMRADGKYYSTVDDFVDLAMKVIGSKNISDRIIIQSFDIRALQCMHQKYPQYKLSYLIDANEVRPLNELIKILGFTPEVLSPQSTMVTQDFIKQCHQLKMKIIPWTVNDLQEIKQLKTWSADGVISDYPDLFSLL